MFSAIAHSKKNVIRGLHFQTLNKQTKVIYVVRGKILDVVVNLNKKSKFFGKTFKYILNEGDILVVPNKYAHGYECLSKTCTVLYHLDNYRNSKTENGILYNDKKLRIKWITKNQFYQLEINKVNLLIILKKELYLYNLFKYLIKFFIKAFASIKLIKKIF